MNLTNNETVTKLPHKKHTVLNKVRTFSMPFRHVAYCTNYGQILRYTFGHKKYATSWYVLVVLDRLQCYALRYVHLPFSVVRLTNEISCQNTYLSSFDIVLIFLKVFNGRWNDLTIIKGSKHCMNLE